MNTNIICKKLKLELERMLICLRGATRQQCWALHPPQTLFTFNYGADTAVPLALPTSNFYYYSFICLILTCYNQMLLYSCIFGLWPMCLGTKVAIRTCLASKLPSGCSSLSETVRRVLRPLDIKVVFHPLHTLCHQLVCPKDPVYQWTNKQD